MAYRSLTLLAAALILGAASGNADARGRKYSCPLPDKRACISAESVYEATHNGHDLILEDEKESKRSRRSKREVASTTSLRGRAESVGGTPVLTPDRCCSPVSTEVTVKGDTLAVASPNGALGAEYYGAPSATEMVVRTTREEPFRVAAKVMRIYISPWVDEQGDLHMGGHVFSEIEPRKWTVGQPALSADSEFRLLKLNSPARDAAQDAKN